MTSSKVEPEEIAKLAIGGTLTLEETAELAQCLERVEIPANRRVVSSGRDDREAYLLLSGQLKVCRTNDRGKETIFGFVEPGEWTGELALINGSRRTADVVALRPSVLGRLTHEAFASRASKMNGLLLVLLRLLGGRLTAASDKISLLAYGAVEERLMHALRTLARPSGALERLLVVHPRPTHQDLAALIGTSREAVTRSLGVLEDAGTILVEDDTIFLKLVNGRSDGGTGAEGSGRH